MPLLNEETLSLAQNLSVPEKEPLKPGEETISVSKTVSSAAVIYEAARNAVEFRAEHLIRRAAIERILKRKILMGTNGKIGESLIRELLWARYLENDSLPVRKIPEIEETIKKYLLLRSLKPYASDWLLGLASCEIEKKLVPAPHREALINFAYQVLKKRFFLPEENESKTHDIQIYLGVHRGFVLSDDPLLRFHLFLSYYPDFMELTSLNVEKITDSFDTVYKEIENQLNYPLKDQIRRSVSKIVAPFNVLRDLAEIYPQEFGQMVSDSTLLEERAKRILERRYQESKAKLRRAAVRSIIYIFLTKMIFALLLEFPYDLLIHKINYLALGINSLFPPFLMFLVTASIKIPDEENTKKVISKIKEFILQDSPLETIVKIHPQVKSRIFTSGFTFLYFLTYLFIFGSILFLLNRLQFNLVSQAIFIFFLTLVSFFGYRVRLTTKSYEITEKEWVVTPIVDFLFLPILRVGQYLSGELAQVNIFIFIFDFVIEAPFKAFFSVFEKWLHFVQTKTEEITS